MTAGDLEPIVLSEMGRLYRVARRLTKNGDGAADLVGTTLLTAFKTCSRFDGRFPRAWLIKIMRNHYLHTTREPTVAAPLSSFCNHITDPRAHAAFLDRIHALDVIAALDKLPDEFRMAIVLCDMEEFDYREAAAALELPVGTIRSRLSRGRKMLQNHLATWSAEL